MRSRPFSSHPTAGGVLAAAIVTACAPAEHTAQGPQELPVLALSQTPVVEIGVMEGDAHYTFQDVVGVLPLPSGEVAVSDGGAAELTLYAPDGTFVRRWGGKGKGPGEFRALSRIYAGDGDSILALDNATRRVSVFDSAGDFGHQMAAVDLTGDSVFSMDVWLYGRFWVDGALDADTRARVKRTLDRLPPPTAAPGYRVVRVAADGRLWIREPGVDPQGRRSWTVLTTAGEPEAVIDIPGRFDPQFLGPRRLLGRWTGESDVNFVRAYGVEDTGTKRPTPEWLSAPPDTTAVTPADEKEVRALIVDAIKHMAVAQEIHYAAAYTYTSNVDSLKWERPKDITVDFVNAGRRGWVAVFTHPGFDRICGLGYGFTVPPGWSPGAVICGPPVATMASTPQGS